MTNTINNTETVAIPMESTMTKNKVKKVSDLGETKVSNPHYTIAGLLEVFAKTWITPEQWDANQP